MVSKRVPTTKTSAGTETRASRAKKQPVTKESSSGSEERRRRTAIAAYYRAEARGFAPGGELEDWLAAEREIELESTTAAPSSPAAVPKGTDGLDKESRPAGKTAQKRIRPTRGAPMDARKQGDRS